MRKGFTLLELLVVIIVVSLLVLLAVVVIGRARESSRRQQCTNNLKQLAIAVHTFHDATKRLPKANYQPQFCTEKHFNEETGTYGNRELYGLHPVLLPYIESNPHYETLVSNWPDEGDVLAPWDAHWITLSPAAFGKFPNEKTVGTVQYPQFLCPSDPAGKDRGENEFGRTNYHGCRGDIWVDWLSPSTRGVFVSGPNEPINFGGIPDGTSNTMMFAECAIGNNFGGKNAPVRGGLAYGMPYGPDEVPMRCLERAGEKGKLTGEQNHDVLTDHKGPGLCWLSGLQVNDQFFAILPPNSPSCSSENDWQNWAMISASSYHVGGCNITMADGSAHFVNNNVNCGDLNQSVSDFEKGNYKYKTGYSEAEHYHGFSPRNVWGSIGCRYDTPPLE